MILLTGVRRAGGRWQWAILFSLLAICVAPIDVVSQDSFASDYRRVLQHVERNRTFYQMVYDSVNRVVRPSELGRAQLQRAKAWDNVLQRLRNANPDTTVAVPLDLVLAPEVANALRSRLPRSYFDRSIFDYLHALQRLSASYPDNPLIWFDLSTAWFEVGNVDSARACLLRSRKARWYLLTTIEGALRVARAEAPTEPQRLALLRPYMYRLYGLLAMRYLTRQTMLENTVAEFVECMEDVHRIVGDPTFFGEGLWPEHWRVVADSPEFYALLEGLTFAGAIDQRELLNSAAQTQTPAKRTVAWLDSAHEVADAEIKRLTEEFADVPRELSLRRLYIGDCKDDVGSLAFLHPAKNAGDTDEQVRVVIEEAAANIVTRERGIKVWIYAAAPSEGEGMLVAPQVRDITKLNSYVQSYVQVEEDGRLSLVVLPNYGAQVQPQRTSEGSYSRGISLLGIRQHRTERYLESPKYHIVVQIDSLQAQHLAFPLKLDVSHGTERVGDDIERMPDISLWNLSGNTPLVDQPSSQWEVNDRGELFIRRQDGELETAGALVTDQQYRCRFVIRDWYADGDDEIFIQVGYRGEGIVPLEQLTRYQRTATWFITSYFAIGATLALFLVP